MKKTGLILLLLGGLMMSAIGGFAAETLDGFLAEYQQDYHKLFCDVSYSWWDAMTLGTDEAFEKYTQATIAMSAYHSSKEKFDEFKRLLAEAEKEGELPPLLKRETDEVRNAFEQAQFPQEIMEKMTKLSGEIEQMFQNQRGELDGKEYTNNELLEMLEKRVRCIHCLKVRTSILTTVGFLHLAAKGMRDELCTIADAQHGYLTNELIQIHFERLRIVDRIR